MERTITNGSAAGALASAPRAAGLAVLAALACAACAAVSPIPSGDYLERLLGEAPDFSAVPDGTYRGTYGIVPPAGVVVAQRTVSMEVDVAGGTLAAVRVIEPEDDDDLERLAADIAAAGTTDVDAVSGASYTEAALKLAVKEAVK